FMMKTNCRKNVCCSASAVALALLLSGISKAMAAEPALTPQTANVSTGTNVIRRPQSRFPRPEVKYQLVLDSQRKEGVPRGKITDHDWKESKVFTNTIRHWSIYVPAQYNPNRPAALMVFQDGHTYLKEDGDFRVPIVFDNLIHAKEM